jgi:hypothetical protein
MSDFGRFRNNPDRCWPKTRGMQPEPSPITYSKIILAAVVVVSAAHTAALAQSSTAQAETLFRQGKELMSKGKIAEACAAFDASQKLDPTIATLLNQASCREKNGQLATAWGLFLDAERQSRGATDDATRQLHKVATDHAAKLEPRLSTLTITVAAENRVGGLETLRNTDTVDPGAWNKALPVDGGSYKVTARAPGNAEWSSTITVAAERDAKTIEIPKLKAAALKSAPVAATDPPPSSTQDNATTSGSRSKVVPLAVGAGALILGGVAIVLEISARSTYDKTKQEPDEAKQKSLWDQANNKRYAAIGLGIGGVACAGVAVWLYLRSGGESEATSTTVQARRLNLLPIISSDQAGLVLQGRY